jgi:hypothetical protein
MIKKQTRSLLEELESVGKNRDTTHIIESRATSIIASAIHLLEVIDRNYSKEQAEILERKLLIAIKNRNGDKFTNSLKRTESKE